MHLWPHHWSPPQNKYLDIAAPGIIVILPMYAKNSPVLALLEYVRYTLIKHNSKTLKPIIESSQFEKDEVLRFSDQYMAVPPSDI